MKIVYLADQKESIPTLVAWFFEEWSYLNPERTREDFMTLLSERTNKMSLPLALVAIDSEDVVGSVSLKVHDMETRPELTPWLASLYVAKGFRRRGIGAKLVNAIEEKARELGIEKLYLFTPQSEHFYSKLGWSTKERTVYHGHPGTIMEKASASKRVTYSSSDPCRYDQ